MSQSLQLLPLYAHDLPSMTKTRTGVEFSPAAGVWNYRDGVKTIRLHFNEIRAPFALCQSLKRVLTWYAEHESPSHLENLFERFKHFARTVQLEDAITSSHLLNYRGTLHRRTEWYLTSLSGLLKRWHRMRIPGISEDAITLLKTVRLKGNVKGIAVQTMDPENGRFTDVELESIRQALKNGYDAGTIGQDEYVLALLFIAFGSRPMQYAAMKVCDLTASVSADSSITYIISIPRAKRRGQTLRFTFKKRTLLPELGELVKEYSDEIQRQFVGVLENPRQAPLFPATERPETLNAAGFEFHRTRESLAGWFKSTMDKLCVRSERTGDLINFTATRFRRTLGCRAADEGHGELVIAELLDHTDTQNVGVYVEATPGMIERIDHAVALRLAPMAQAFAGVIVTDESQARRAGDPTSRIADPRFDPSMKPMGNCGKYGFCGLLAPIACYTCRSFEPWLDGPHERVLDFLIAERDRLLTQTDKRIASINDRTILAVADVVSRCTAIKDGRKEDQNG